VAAELFPLYTSAEDPSGENVAVTADVLPLERSSEGAVGFVIEKMMSSAHAPLTTPSSSAIKVKIFFFIVFVI